MMVLNEWGGQIPVPLTEAEAFWIAATPCSPKEWLVELGEELIPSRKALAHLATGDPITLGKMLAEAARGINSGYGYDLTAARSYMLSIASVETAAGTKAERFAEEGIAYDPVMDMVELPFPLTVWYSPGKDQFIIHLTAGDIVIRDSGDGPTEVVWEEA